MIDRPADLACERRPGDTLLFGSTALHGPQQIVTRPNTDLSIIVSARADGPRRPVRRQPRAP